MALTARREADAVRRGLERWLGRPVGAIDRPEPGWSCETLIADRELVVRLPPVSDGIFPAYDLAQQAAVQEAAGAAGVPVAAPVRYEPDPSYLGAPFVAMPFVAGPIPAEFTPADPWLAGLPDDAARHAVWRSFLATLSSIHATSPTGRDLRTGVDAELAFWRDYVEWGFDGSPPAVLVDALTWCEQTRPAHEPAGALLWGDVRLGNVVFDDASLAPKAVLDWDMVSVGPVEMDLAWFLVLEQLQTDLSGMRVPGFGTRTDAIAAVEASLGRPLVDLAWHEVFALVRASAISNRIAVLFARAGQRSMFAVGRDPTLAAALERIASRG